MAGIDKTYLDYHQYLELKEWCKDKSFTLSNGDVIKPSKYLFIWFEDDWEKDPEEIHPVWNTPYYMDRWLKDNCPLSFIQERLQEQYDDLDTAFDCYDEYTRPEGGYHYSIIKKPKFNIRIKPRNRITHKKFKTNYFYINIEDFEYNEKHDAWYHWQECLPWDSDCYCMKDFNFKKLQRKLKKWNLPKGTHVNIQGHYIGQEWEIVIK